MPITQERFIAIVNASADIVDRVRKLREITTPNLTRTMIEANAFLARSESAEANAVVNDLIAALGQVRDIIDETNMLATNASIAVQVEREHFRRYAKKNAKAAELQRKARVLRGATPRYAPQGLIHEGLSTNPHPLTTQQEQRIRAEMGSKPNIEDDPAYQKVLAELNSKWVKDKPSGKDAAASYFERKGE